MGPESLEVANFILNAVQVGGLIGFMTTAIVSFVRGWIYPASTVQELRIQVKELTQALGAIGSGVDKLADAWDERNKQEADKIRDDLLLERLKREGNR